jgi:aminoglycoside N3'-acetyltransferase
MIGRATLADQLTRLGVQPASSLMVHASLRKIGPIDGGAEALLDALIETLGPRGTLLMVLGADDEEPFDALRSPVDEDDMGVLAEVFRTRRGVRVNDHAAARYGALGPQSPQLLEPVPLHDYHGPGSVLERFANSGGFVLRLGAALDTVTLTHWAEYVARVPNKRRARRRYERADSGEQWIEGLDDDDGIVDWEQGDYFPQILLDFLKTGQARVGPVGGCTAELFPAKTFVDFAVARLEGRFSL